MTLAALATFGTAPATAVSDARTAAPAAAALEYRDTTMVAGQPNPFGVHVNMMPRAKLTETETGAPVEGATVLFMIETPIIPVPVCHATTNANGVAKCGGARALFDILYVGKGTYRAWFQGKQTGDVYWFGSEDTVRLLGRQ